MHSGPAYASDRAHNFLQQWNVHHTGIPHSHTGQAIVGHAHKTLKTILEKQEGEELGYTHNRLAKTLYVLYF